VVSTPLAAPVIAATRLRRGPTNSARGAARLIGDTLRTVAACGPRGLVIVRADSAYYGHDVIAAAIRGGARFSVTTRANPAVTRAIASIPADGWTRWPGHPRGGRRTGRPGSSCGRARGGGRSPTPSIPAGPERARPRRPPCVSIEPGSFEVLVEVRDRHPRRSPPARDDATQRVPKVGNFSEQLWGDSPERRQDACATHMTGHQGRQRATRRTSKELGQPATPL